jgi:hypothetical protein
MHAAAKMLPLEPIDILYRVIKNEPKCTVCVQGATPIGWKAVRQMPFGRFIDESLRVCEGNDEINQLESYLNPLERSGFVVLFI